MMQVSRRGLFALPVALPFVFSAKPVETATVEVETGTTIGKLKWFNTKRGFGFVAIGDEDAKVTTAMLREIGLDEKLIRPGIWLRVHWLSPKDHRQPVATRIEFARPADEPRLIYGEGQGVVGHYDAEHKLGFIDMDDRRKAFFYDNDLRDVVSPGDRVLVKWRARDNSARKATAVSLV